MVNGRTDAGLSAIHSVCAGGPTGLWEPKVRYLSLLSIRCNSSSVAATVKVTGNRRKRYSFYIKAISWGPASDSGGTPV